MNLSKLAYQARVPVQWSDTVIQGWVKIQGYILVNIYGILHHFGAIPYLAAGFGTGILLMSFYGSG